MKLLKNMILKNMEAKIQYPIIRKKLNKNKNRYNKLNLLS